MKKRDFIIKQLQTIGENEDFIVHFIDRFQYTEEIVSKMPRASCLDVNIARELSVTALAAADVCSELVAEMAQINEILNIRTKEEEARAQLERSKESTAGKQKVDSQRDAAYVAMQIKAANAKTLMEAMRRRYDILTNLHQLCKAMLRNTLPYAGQTQFDPTENL